MPRRIFSNKAKRAWWSVHIEAWRQSGLAASAYCRLHDLPRHMFKVWQTELAEWEAQKAEERRRWKRRHGTISTDRRRKATQAFWAMHVEAWQWSGLPLRDYAATLRLSAYSLKRWRNLIDAQEVVIDWRAMLHPSARPPISINISTSTKEKERAQALTAAIEAAAGPPKRATRRRYTMEQKIALVMETERHGESVSSVGRAHGIATSVLFRWRDQLGLGKEKPAVLVPVRVMEKRSERGGEPSLLAGHGLAHATFKVSARDAGKADAEALERVPGRVLDIEQLAFEIAPEREQQAQPIACRALDMHGPEPARADDMRQRLGIVLVGLVALCRHRRARIAGLQTDHRNAQRLQLGMQPGRERSGLVADTPQGLSPWRKRFRQRLGFGGDARLVNDRPRRIDDAQRSGFHRDIKSGKMLHGCPPGMASGARRRLRFSTAIMGDNHPSRYRHGRTQQLLKRRRQHCLVYRRGRPNYASIRPPPSRSPLLSPSPLLDRGYFATRDCLLTP